MHSPLQPWQKPPQHPPAPSQYLGTDASGHPVYGVPATQPVAPLQPIVARPWGMYIAGGCAVAVVGFFLLIGLAIVALALGCVAVCLTICTLVLRSMWHDYQNEKDW